MRLFLAALVLAGPAFAGDIVIEDAYARANTPRAGAAFMVIRNEGETPDRLVSVSSEAAMRVELHTHRETGDGIMQMIEVEDGFAIPAGAEQVLARGGDHVMFMGLSAPWAEGDTIPVTLTFETAGDMQIEIPVDLSR